MERLTIGPAEISCKDCTAPGSPFNCNLVGCYTRAMSRLAMIEKILGDTYDLDRLRELVEADRDGRVVILPAVIVYEVMDAPGPACDEICPVEIDGKPCCNFCEHGIEVVAEVRCRQDHIERIGKDVFLTREEAEAALKKREGSND